MIIQTFTPVRYRGCPIYIRRLDKNTFEYLTIINNEIYAMHQEAPLFFYARFLKVLGIMKDFYTERQLKRIVNNIQKRAETVIDLIKDKNSNKEPEKIKLNAKDLQKLKIKLNGESEK